MKQICRDKLCNDGDYDLIYDLALESIPAANLCPHFPTMIERDFWGWDQTVLDQATVRLMNGWTGGELDLSGTLIIVPTAESARRLREALAKATAQRDGAAVVPHVWAPEQALLVGEDREREASYLASLFAWTRVLSDIDFSAFTRLFPQPPAHADWSWAIATAQMMLELGSTLGAGGWSFAQVASSDQARADADRWHELAVLERLYLDGLAKDGHCDMQSLKAARADHPWLPEGVQRVIVFAAPDLPPLLTRWIAAAGERCLVTLCIQAPQDLAHCFDSEGRPAPDFWAKPDALPAPLAIEHMHLGQNAARQADVLVGQITALAQQGRTAIGVCDAEVTSAIKERLVLEDVRVFEPGGVPPQTQGLWHVLTCCRDLVATASWRSLAALLRVPEVRTALSGGGEGSGTTLLEAADDLSQNHLPVTLDHALELLPSTPDKQPNNKLRVALYEARKMIASFERRPLDEAIRNLLIRLYGERLFTPNAPADRAHLELADLVLETAIDVRSESQRSGLEAKGAEAFALVLEQASKSMLTEPRGEVDVVLQGWLELLWEDAPCVAVAGFNEENVPGILVSHPFLPDSLRAALGLPCQATRYARDAYLLHALAAQRQPGALHVLCGQQSERGDTLRPSRLLFRGPDGELPQRVARLFPKDEDHATITEPPRSLAWKLRPRIVPVELKKVSASLLNSYLACPFRFYLGNLLHMQAVEADKRELGANEFGSLIHVAFQRMAADPGISTSTNEAQIGDFLEAAAKAETHRLYGRHLPVLVQLQLETAVQRLRAAAAYEAASRAEGWLIDQAEVVLKGELMIEGLPFTGKIDRIEQRQRGGRTEVRLIDFKTSDKALDPLTAHVREIKAQSRYRDEDEWQVFDAPDGKRRQWQNLQLPLYAAALAAQGIRDVRVAYFNLPKNIQDTTLSEWPDFNQAWIDEAKSCAAQAIQRIRQGLFWPPAKAKYDDYAELFLGDVMTAVEFHVPGSPFPVVSN